MGKIQVKFKHLWWFLILELRVHRLCWLYCAAHCPHVCLWPWFGLKQRSSATSETAYGGLENEVADV